MKILNDWLIKNFGRISKYSAVIIAGFVLLLLVFFLHQECDEFSFNSEIDAEKFYYFFSILGALATFFLLFVGFQQLKEMKKQFLIARRPELYFAKVNPKLNLDNIQNLSNTGNEGVTFCNEQFIIKVENIGLGIAKDIELKWDGPKRKENRVSFFPAGERPIFFQIPYIKNNEFKEISLPLDLLESIIFSETNLEKWIQLKKSSLLKYNIGHPKKKFNIENEIKLLIKYTDAFASEVIEKSFCLNIDGVVLNINETTIECSLDLILIEEIAS
jgi:hypothetical protein